MKPVVIKILALAALVAFLPGCAVLFGTDVRGLSEVKEEHVKVFDKDVSYCYERTRFILTKWGAVAYDKIRGEYIVAMKLDRVFPSCIDTTELGIFFTEIEPHKTEVKVTSLNYNLSKAVSRKLFYYLEHGEKRPPVENAPAPWKPAD